MNYKKILRSQHLRLTILKFFNWIPDRLMLKIQYRIKMGRACNLNNPLRWTEKLQLYKMNYRNPVLPICVDKYRVREYVEKKGLGHILVQLYAVWDNADEIDFKELPNSFVLKTNDGGGGLNVVLVNEKNNVNLEDIKMKFSQWQGQMSSNPGREWAYTGIKDLKIIAEELLINKENPKAGIEDFKILCFNGQPHYIIVDKDRYINHKRNFYTTSWERIDVTTDHEQFDTEFPKPSNLDEMLKTASILSQDFPFVRVDLYNLDRKIYFGELTFYPWTGYVQFYPDSFDYELGNLMDITSIVNDK